MLVTFFDIKRGPLQAVNTLNRKILLITYAIKMIIPIEKNGKLVKEKRQMASMLYRKPQNFNTLK